MQQKLTSKEPLTFETVWASIQESNRYLTEKFAETDRLFKESAIRFKETERALKERSAETERALKERSAEAERIQQAKNAEADKRWEETKKDINEINKKYWGISKSNGEVAEEYFINSFAQNPYFAHQEFEIVTPNLHHRNKQLQMEGEYDLVLINCTSVVIIEVKYKARKEDVEALLTKPESFKKYYKEYSRYKFYLGLAGFTVEKSAETKAKKHGIAIIKQVGETMVVNDEHLKVY